MSGAERVCGGGVACWDVTVQDATVVCGRNGWMEFLEYSGFLGLVTRVQGDTGLEWEWNCVLRHVDG
jgi:hypothetical protein